MESIDSIIDIRMHLFERLLISRRNRSVPYRRMDRHAESPEKERKSISREDWEARFDREKVLKEDLDLLIHDFLDHSGKKAASESFKMEANLKGRPL